MLWVGGGGSGRRELKLLSVDLIETLEFKKKKKKTLPKTQVRAALVMRLGQSANMPQVVKMHVNYPGEPPSPLCSRDSAILYSASPVRGSGGWGEGCRTNPIGWTQTKSKENKHRTW